MSNIFKIIQGSAEDKFSLGLKVKIAEHESFCAVTDYHSPDRLESEVKALKNELEGILKKLESVKNGNFETENRIIDSAATPEEIWSVLSGMTDNSLLTEQFNSLDEIKRRELADYIFANCNMFTGKGAFFSENYVHETALLKV